MSTDIRSFHYALRVLALGLVAWLGACDSNVANIAREVARQHRHHQPAAGSGGQDERPWSPCPVNEACTILPLGDSITYGLGYEGGYRIELFRKAWEDGNQITFTGSQTNGPKKVGDLDFSRAHEGRPGWRIDQLMPLIPSPALDDDPELVLLMIGANDLGQYYDLPNAPERLGALLDKLTDALPDAQIFVATTTPFIVRRTEVVAYNDAIPAIVEERIEEGKHLQLVDQYTDFPDSELGDDVHPNAAGYERMAAVWYDAIRDYLR